MLTTFLQIFFEFVFLKILGSKNTATVNLQRYPQFVAILFYTIFAALFKI